MTIPRAPSNVVWCAACDIGGGGVKTGRNVTVMQEGSMDDDDDDEHEVDPWEACWEEPMSEPFCLYSVLGLKSSSEGDVASRVRAAFHSCAQASWPREDAPNVPSYARQVRRFRRLCLALTVLKDPERRRIYAVAGFDGLRQSEAYQESSAFDQECAAARSLEGRPFAAHASCRRSHTPACAAAAVPTHGSPPLGALAARPTSSKASSKGGRRRTESTCC